MAWVVAPALNALLAELNSVAPGRDKSSDGSIGDQAHSTSPSGHNPDETGKPEDFDADSVDEVRARDFDTDLNRPGLNMEMVCQFLVQACRAGRITWIKYIIFNSRIWTASNGWVTQTYTGSNTHSQHMHVSCKPDTASENTTRPVGLATLLEPAMPSLDEIANAVWGKTFTYLGVTRPASDVILDPFFMAMFGTTRGGDPFPPKGAPAQILSAITASRAENAARDAAAAEMIRGLVDLITQAGGDVDSAAIIAKIEQLGARVDEAAKSAGEDAAQAVVGRFAAAQEAEAASLRGDQRP